MKEKRCGSNPSSFYFLVKKWMGVKGVNGEWDGIGQLDITRTIWKRIKKKYLKFVIFSYHNR